jgi:hypothetical protein
VRRICTTLSLIGVVLAALAVPAGASASHLSRAEFKSTSKYCKALRAEMGTKAFKQAFRAKRVRGAHRRCIKKKGAVRALAPVSVFPAPADPCVPVEPPLPVHAFAVDPCAQPAPVVACGEDDDAEDEEGRGSSDDEAEPESDDAACEDSAGDDGNGDDGDDADDEDDEDERHSDDGD